MKACNKIIFIVIAFVLIGVYSCGPAAKQRRSEKKLARLIEKHPELVKTDTVFVDSTIVTPEVIDSGQVDLQPSGNDSAAVDSLTGHFSGRVDSLILDSLNKGFKGLINNAGEFDTIIPLDHGKARVSRKNGKLRVNIEVDPPDQKIRVPVVVNSVQPIKRVEVQKVTWYERIFYHITDKIGVTGWCFILALIVFLTYRLIRKYILD